MNMNPMTNMPAAQAVDGAMLRMLSEIGFLATKCGLWPHAEVIFMGVEAVRPASEFPFMSHAIARMTVGDDATAINLLQNKALKINPQNSMARSFLGMALKRSGKTEEAHQHFDTVIAANDDAKATEMARMGLLEEFTQN